MPENLPSDLTKPEENLASDNELIKPSEEIISTMPSRFKRGKRQVGQEIYSPKSSQKRVYIFIVLGIILVLMAGVGFWFWASFYLKPKTPSLPSEIETPKPTPPVYQSPELKLTAEVREKEGGELLSSAELFLPAGALADETVFEFQGLTSPTEMTTSTFALIAGLYEIKTSVLPNLLKPITLKINYSESLINSSWESSIKIGYFKDNLWTPLTETNLDVVNNIASVSLSTLPANTFALIVERSRIEATVSKPSVIAPQISSSEDPDYDGLTNTEEAIYQTDPNNPDTDGDSVPDGFEVMNLENPKNQGVLSLSGLINVYTNPSWHYKFFYPAGWLVRALPETENRQIMVVTNTGEFFQILVEDNNEQLSAKNWYLQKSPQIDPVTVKEETIGGLDGAWSPDGLNLYLAKGDKIYIISYNIGTETLANFKSTFQMIIKSFGLIQTSSSSETNSGTE
jgi:hypothetical protein